MGFLCTFFIFSLLSIWILTTLIKKKTIHSWIRRTASSLHLVSLLTSMIINTKSMARIRAPASLKKEFLKKWIMGLQICSPWKKNMSLSHRKNSIKLAADVAMASSAGDASTSWTRSVLANAFARGHDGRVLVEHVHGRNKVSATAKNTRIRSRKILKKCRAVRRFPRQVPPPRQEVKNKIKVLKRLVPGGEFLEDESTLIQETLDYIMSLTAQVDVMRLLAQAAELKNPQ